MDKKKYDELLEKAFKEMPKKVALTERFELPKINAIIQGSKTIIKDFAKIIKDLRREPKETAKYIASEFATACTFNGDDLILKGKFSAFEVQKAVHEYIKEFILCKECNRPDTRITEHSRIKVLKCEACGAIMPMKT